MLEWDKLQRISNCNSDHFGGNLATVDQKKMVLGCVGLEVLDPLSLCVYLGQLKMFVAM